ncbi:MAG: hypothetical protein U0Y96_03045 [Candidatus Kapaibacterium sp.]
MKNRVFIFLLLVSIVTSNVYSQKKPVPDNTSKYQTIESKTGMWSLRLPPSFKIAKTHFTLSDYVTNEILNVKLRIPELKPSDKFDTTWNAVQVECPNGEFATVFGTKGNLGTMQELMIRTEDSRNAIAATRGIKREDVFLAYTSTEFLGGLMAPSADIGTAINSTDSLHTKITITYCDGYTYGIIMRASKTMRVGFPSETNNNYRMIANGFIINSLFLNTTKHQSNKSWSVRLPDCWTTIIKKTTPDPFGKTAVKVEIAKDTSQWNTIYANLGPSQVEVNIQGNIVPLTPEQLHEGMKDVVKYSSEETKKSVSFSESKIISGLQTTHISVVVPRRDDLTRQIIYVAYKNNTQYFVRGICWDRDTPIMENILGEVCKRIAVAP